MPFGSMEQGIKAIQAGQTEEGARLLRIALKDPALTGKLRAVALTWLAETSGDPQYKIDRYKEALDADPSNPDVNARMAYVLSTQLPRGQTAPPPAQGQPPGYTPPTGQPAMPRPVAPTSQTPPYGQPVVTGQTPPYSQQPTAAAQPASYGSGAFFRTVGVVGGPNGAGTAFFVAYNGLLATTRYVTGGVEQVTISLETGRNLPGRVVRAFPEFDLALIQADIAVTNLLPISPRPHIPDDTRLTAIAHNGQVVTGQRRATKRDMPAQWFPTTISTLADAGGDPVFDDGNYLVGMLTKNISRSSGYVFGLHISALFKCVETFSQEVKADSSRTYCPSCGYLSRAASASGFYCEVCGSVLPFAQQTARFPLPQTAAFYGENMYQPCPHCGARVGYYNGACLRCGGEISTGATRR